jgi:hypothetical protein
MAKSKGAQASSGSSGQRVPEVSDVFIDPTPRDAERRERAAKRDGSGIIKT